MSSHLSCWKSISPGGLRRDFNKNRFPARVLDVDITNSKRWRLCIPAEEKIMSSKYTTMTYRWGDADFLKLTVTTLKSFQTSRPMSELPQAFQDAVLVIRSLGIRYLRVDALCILQDSPDDSSHQCAEMSNIYTHSTCNIIAGFGYDPFTSIFSNRDLSLLAPGKIAPYCLDNVDVMLHRDYVQREFANGPLVSRGWILEEFCSRHVLYILGETKYAGCAPPLKPRNYGPKDIHSMFTSASKALPCSSLPSPYPNFSTRGGPLLRDTVLSISRFPKRNYLQSPVWQKCISESSTWSISPNANIVLATGAPTTQSLLNWINSGKSISSIDWDSSTKTYIAPSWSWALKARSLSFSPLHRCFSATLSM